VLPTIRKTGGYISPDETITTEKLKYIQKESKQNRDRYQNVKKQRNRLKEANIGLKADMEVLNFKLTDLECELNYYADHVSKADFNAFEFEMRNILDEILNTLNGTDLEDV